jgi:dihydrofolate reductase
MAKLIYLINTSLDGYIADSAGAIDWANPDQIHDFVTDLVRPYGTFLYGRRMYELMAYWNAAVESYPAGHRPFAEVWQQAEKLVFSQTLSAPTTGRTRLERTFDPEAIRQLKRESTKDISIGGAGLAAAALAADLVDECHLLIHPVLVGGGTPALHVCSRQRLELLDTRHFTTGVVHVHYRVGPSAA